MTILPLTKCTKEEPEEEHRESESPPPSHWSPSPSHSPPLSPNRYSTSTTPISHGNTYYPQPRSPPSPARDKPFISDSWEVERRDGGRRRRRVAGPSRPVPRVPAQRVVGPIPVENRERHNSDDEYDCHGVYDCQVMKCLNFYHKRE